MGENESIPFKCSLHAVFYELFIAVPQVRAFTIFYISLKILWTTFNIIIIKFKLGKSIIQFEVITYSLTLQEYEALIFYYISRTSTCF